MALESFNAYHSYLKAMEPLNDAERGRLFTACLQYSMMGEAPELRGNERFVFPSMAAQIDRDKEKYQSKCKKRSANAKKRWDANACNIMQMDANACNIMQTYANDAKDKDKDKDKDMDKDSVAADAATAARPRACDAAADEPCPGVELDPGLAKAVQCYEANIGALPRYVAERLKSWLTELGPDLVCEAIHRAASANARSWRYAEKILESWRDSGIRTVEAARMEQNTRQRTPRTQAAQQAQTADEVWRRIAEGGDSDDRSGGSRFAAIDGEVLAELPSGR